jgi:hypothetical protein
LGTIKYCFKNLFCHEVHERIRKKEEDKALAVFKKSGVLFFVDLADFVANQFFNEFGNEARSGTQVAVYLEYTASDFIGELFILEHRSFLLKINFCHGTHRRTYMVSSHLQGFRR